MTILTKNDYVCKKVLDKISQLWKSQSSNQGDKIMNNQNRHVEAFRVVNYVFDLMKNDEAALINVGAMWAWSVEPIFSEG